LTSFPESVPVAVPATVSDPHAAVSGPVAVVPSTCVTVHWKFVHVPGAVVGAAEAQDPASVGGPLVVDVAGLRKFVHAAPPTAIVNARTSPRQVMSRSLASIGSACARLQSGPYNDRMAILKVARMGHPVLRTKARPIPPSEITRPGVQRLIDDLFETMHEYSGIGLAAPQVHVGLRVFVAGLRDAEVGEEIADGADMPRIVLVNPEIAPSDEPAEDGWEGCLSIPDIRGLVPRAPTVRVRAYDRQGKSIELTARGLPARVIQHETDHLDGILFFDRMPSLGSLTYMDEYQRFWRKDEEDDEDDED
jgi:peptide deformylase